MSQEARGLFTNLISTRQFLFSKSAPHLEAPSGAAAALSGADILLKTFPDVPMGEAFVAAALEKTRQWDRFGALVMRIEPEAPASGEAERIEAQRLALARALVSQGGSDRRIWGVLDGLHLACYVESADSDACLDSAQAIQQALANGDGPCVTFGAAAYPTIDFGREQILDNAFKALAHAEFLGPGSRVAFDAVSLNISGDKHYDAGDIAGAVEEYRKGLLLDPQNVNIHNSLGVCYGVQGHFDQALAEFGEASRLDEGEIMAVYNTGLTYTLRREIDQGLAYLKKALDLDDNVFEVCLQLGRVSLDAGDADGAHTYLEKARALRPHSAAVLYYLGECHSAGGRYREAVAAYQGAIKNDPNHAAALSALGWLYDRRDESREIALLFCEQSVKIAPENPLFHFRLGWLYLKHGRLDAARAALQAAGDLGHDVAADLEVLQRSDDCGEAQSG